MNDKGRVTGLYIYPVKSCRGISLTEMNIDSRGPQYDRQWMIVDENNQFLTLRTVSKLAEIKTHIHGSFLHLYTGTNKILVNLADECEQIEDVTIWGDTFKAGIENKSINESLSDFLSKTVKLVRYQKQSFRDLELAGTRAVKETMFADSRPVLLVNESSLKDLNEKLKAKSLAPSYIERFRANIIIDGLPSYFEDEIKEVKIGEVLLQNPKPCARCPVITQDVETGEVVSKETLTTLAKDRKKAGGVMFGVNLTPASTGVIKLGDEVVIQK
ncbi:MAG: MOSC N-terminal beta barrel domain-containing protein [Bdellovibrionota bacterium]